MWGEVLLTDDDAALLSYRLYRYRREFSRLVAARNTTKSRFVRLFVICLIVIAVCLPYTAWLVVDVLKVINGPYSWSRVHNPETFHNILKVRMFGHVAPDKWGQVATGYVVIFVFGTGSDAHNTYKKMLLALGLGRFFPTSCARAEHRHLRASSTRARGHPAYPARQRVCSGREQTLWQILWTTAHVTILWQWARCIR
jgi:pheromone a factor receptor